MGVASLTFHSQLTDDDHRSCFEKRTEYSCSADAAISCWAAKEPKTARSDIDLGLEDRGSAGEGTWRSRRMQGWFFESLERPEDLLARNYR